MSTFLLFLLLQASGTPETPQAHPHSEIQEGESAHSHGAPSNAQIVEFEPIYEGNQVPLGNYEMTVPSGVLLASEEDAFLMTRLLRTDDIPELRGVFFSRANDFRYGVSVQLFSLSPFQMGTLLEPSFYEAYFKQIHFFNGQPVAGTVSTVLTPEFDMEQRIATMGFSYENNEEPYKNGVYLRRVFISNDQALILSARIESMADYATYHDEIMSIFDTVVRKKEGAVPPGDPITLHGMLGIFLEYGTPLDLSVILTSVGLGLAGLILLAFAIKLARKQ